MAGDKNTAARPYAKAAFEFALAAQKMPQWSTALQASAIVSLDERVSPLLIDPRISNEQLFSLFNDVCNSYLDENSSNFIKLLAENQRLNLLPEMSVLYESYRAEQEKTLEVDVASFMPLSDEQQQRLRESLKTRLQRDVELQCRVDEKILGGLIVRAGDLVIDGSVLGQLEKMRHEVVE